MVNDSTKTSWNVESMYGKERRCVKKVGMLFLTLCLILPCISLASDEFALPGRMVMMTYSDGKLYFQVETYPTSSVYFYTPENMEQPELLCNDFRAEEDIIVVANGKLYVWDWQDALVPKDDSNPSISLHTQEIGQRSKDYMPFLMSVDNEHTLTWIMSYGEEIVLCHIDLATDAFKYLNLGIGLFSVQPYQNGNSLAVVTRDDGRKEILEINWDTLEQSTKGYLEVDTTAVAYDTKQDVLWYLREGALWCYLWAGESEKVMDNLPQWPDQRSYVLDGNKLVLSDDINLITIELPTL